MAYRVVDHTADLGIEVEASTLSRLFEECLLALTDCLTRAETVRREISRNLRLAAGDPEELLVEFLGEAIYLHETQGLVFGSSRVTVARKDEEWRLEAVLEGEVFDLDRHGLKTLIKAITYHQLEVEQRGDGWAARVIFDI